MRQLSKMVVLVAAELIRWSSPWFLRQQCFALLSRVCRPVFFILAVALFVLFPSAEEYATYRVAPLEEFWGTLFPIPADVVESPMLPDDAASSLLLNDADFAAAFPAPLQLQPHIAFWKAVYGRYTSRQILLHDSWYPQVVYEVIDRDAEPAVNITSRIRAYRSILRSLHRKAQQHDLETLTADEAGVYRLFAGITEQNRFANAAQRAMRGQSGQRDRFLRALHVSGKYQEEFTRIFHAQGLPVELVWLPFVESFYNHTAYSQAGAAGVWQFIASTARLYGLTISSAADERFDPFKSADAAARLLKANYEQFGTWPLALSAYHHGNAGMARAVRQFGADDFGEIAIKYRSRSFGYYSRNYYAQFVAVAQLLREKQQEFAAVNRLPAVAFEEVGLERRMYLNEIAATLQIEPDALEALNPDLKKTVLQSRTPIPKQFRLKLPAGTRDAFLASLKPQ